MNRKKIQMIERIKNLLYDFTAEELESIYGALSDIMYKEDKKKWTTKLR